jgi:hypothetical protein
VQQPPTQVVAQVQHRNNATSKLTIPTFLTAEHCISAHWAPVLQWPFPCKNYPDEKHLHDLLCIIPDNVVAPTELPQAPTHLQQACVVGHSYGTFVASRLVQAHRAFVHSVALVDPVCFGMFLVSAWPLARQGKGRRLGKGV